MNARERYRRARLAQIRERAEAKREEAKREAIARIHRQANIEAALIWFAMVGFTAGMSVVEWVQSGSLGSLGSLVAPAVGLAGAVWLARKIRRDFGRYPWRAWANPAGVDPLQQHEETR